MIWRTNLLLNNVTTAFLFAAALLSMNAPATAQQTGVGSAPGRGSGAGASHSIRGKIFMPSGNTPEQRLRVVLEVSTGGTVSEAFSDSAGNFEFRGLSNGTYRISVPSDNRTYETTQEAADIFSNFARTVVVQIYLRERDDGASFRPNNKLVSAADLQDVPKAAKKSYEQAVKLARENKPQEASVKLQDAIKIYPDYLYALNKLGEQYLALNQFNDAQAVFERAVKVNPKFALPRINLGVLLLQQKHYAEAVTSLEEGLRQDDSYPMGHLNLGLALMSKNPPDLDRAEKELFRALEMGKKEMIYVHKYLFNLNVRRQNLDKAAEQLEAYLKELPNAPDASEVRQMLSKVKKAIERQKEQAHTRP